jgi:hypothetical protein
MFFAGALTFQEFIMHESLPLATIQQAVLEFLQGRNDAVVFGAQAVNAYVNEPRMTQDIDLLSSRAEQFTQELRDYLGERFHIAVRVRQVGQGKGYRLFQVQKPHNRHLVDVRSVETLPPAQRMADVLVMAPVELIASKVIAYCRRRGQPKSGTDWRDLAMLLLAFPEFKRDQSIVADRLRTAGAEPAVLTLWKELAAQEIHSEDEDGEF